MKEDNVIEPELNLREIYNKYFHPNVIPLNDPRIWDALSNVSVINTFQFDSQVGVQAAKMIKPQTVLEMADANGLMRLMGEDGAERPLDKYVRFKQNLNLWYKEMDDFGLTKIEQSYLEPYFKSSYGVPPSQEQLMRMLMDKNICHFSLGDANNARKIVGKKQMSKIPELKQKVLDQASSSRLGEYVWKYGAGPQMGYSFSVIHALAYSFIGVQTLYIATNWNPIYWNTACLIVNSGSLENNSEEEIVSIYEPEYQELLEGTTFIDLPDRSGKIKKTASTDYSKLAKAIGDTQKLGINLSLVNINKSGFSFRPDVENNQILYGMKGMLNVSDAVVEDIIANRPYISPRDFLNKVKPGKQAMISLIKGGAFDSMMDRKMCMAWYIWETCDKKKKLTLQNMGSLIKYNLLPEETDMARRVYQFNRYLKAVCKHNSIDYKLDERAVNFIYELEGIEESLKYTEGGIFLEIKIWEKFYQKTMDIIRNWIAENKDVVLTNLNSLIFKEDWIKYAEGNISAWEMNSLCFYYHEHELANVNPYRYGFANYQELPEDPVIDRSFTKGGKTINIYKLCKICGTCIAKNKTKGIATILTTSGVVNVKMSKELFSMFDRQISERQADGTKKVKEKSWFNRGSMIIVQGMRSGDNFVCKKYSSTPGHHLYKIDKVNDDGTIEIRSERYKGIAEDD